MATDDNSLDEADGGVLLDSPKDYRTLVERTSDLITVLDGDGRIRYQSPSVERILGYDPESSIGETPFPWVHSADEAMVREVFDGLRRHSDEITERVEFRIEDAAGEWVWLETVGTNRTESAIDGYVFTSRDVTDKVERLREREAILDRIDEVFCGLDDDWRFTYLNEAAEEFAETELDRTAEGLLGERIWDAVPELRDTEVEDALRSAAEIREPIETETESVIRGGWIALRVYPDEDGLSVYFHDITERREQVRELRRQNERLEKFASIVAHDIRNPLNVASGYLDIAYDGEDDDLRRAEEALDRVEGIVEDVLALARDGRTVEETEEVALGTHAEECWANVSTASADLYLETDMTIRADRSRLRHCFENLFRNAIEHGGEDVGIAVGPLDEGFFVEDNGPGIPEEERPNAFEPGYSTEDHGTGLGLPIVQEIADAHGWDVRIAESRSGGARFEFTGVEIVE